MNRRTLLPLLDHVLACALIAVVSCFWFGRPLWRTSNAHLLLVAILSAGYLTAAVIVTRSSARAPGDPVLRPFSWGMLCFGVAFIGVELARWHWPDAYEKLPTTDGALFFLFAGLASLCALTVARDWLAGGFGLVVPVALAASAAGVAYFIGSGASRGPTRDVDHIESNLHLLQVTTYRGFLKGDRASGGAIAAFGDRYLVAAGDGALYEVAESGGDDLLAVRPLAYRVPINAGEFAQAARAAFGETWTDNYHRERLRVADLLVQSRPGGAWRLLVSHHGWRVAESCYSTRVSALEGTREQFLAADSGLEWRTVYESDPCVTFNVDGHRGAWFAGYQIGGAMALLGEDSLLVAVGDHEYDGWNRTPLLPQDPESPYGKIHRIDLETGRVEMWSLGHRNPQGLYVDAAGAVWSTEHGPRGGDELNLIRQGANYGWPLETYGTEYSLDHWPVAQAAVRPDEFTQPVLAFVPSIALSALTGISGGPFARWDGDLLLVSLSGTLRRIHVAESRAVVDEPIHIHHRLRDVAQGRDGRLALWTDARDVIFLQPADADSPQALKMQCSGCHTFNRREHASIGPNLWQVVDRRVASEGDFEYSQGLREHGGRWTRERLDEFLADPSAAVPGTTMQFEGIQDPEKRRRLVDFLEELN